MSTPPGRMPYVLREKLKGELHKMVQMKTIQTVNEPTDWVNNLVLVKKLNGSLKICIDPKE